MPALTGDEVKRPGDALEHVAGLVDGVAGEEVRAERQH